MPDIEPCVAAVAELQGLRPIRLLQHDADTPLEIAELHGAQAEWWLSDLRKHGVSRQAPRNDSCLPRARGQQDLRSIGSGMDGQGRRAGQGHGTGARPRPSDVPPDVSPLGRFANPLRPKICDPPPGVGQPAGGFLTFWPEWEPTAPGHNQLGPGDVRELVPPCPTG
ncbi:hypothetical protein A1Q2_07165 [Trichosporon asahii var. asahii CBS 8904]|uniref:Uncharacterized protein n=1 Tax=Trichosporon asahii var. asahii (strain CBS 8904) TaxID=1220162 RepID=K1V3P2_TRIAC|nr:hypothetical protein A1Q2_07165 [Trichosporon asahii var. asahii CBS 8904]